MEVVYGTLLAVGAIVLILSFVFGEFGSDHDGFMLLSPLSIASGLVAGGAMGLVCELLHLSILSVVPAVVAGVVVYGVVISLKKTIMKQESNTHFGTHSYLNSEATVISAPIQAGNWGMVSFKDVTGARVSMKAHNTHKDQLPTGSKVVIHTIENGELYVAPLES